jgi:hypothetical protein
MFYDPKKNSASSIASHEETQTTTNLLNPLIKNSNSTKPPVVSDNPRCPSPQSPTCTGPTVPIKPSFPPPPPPSIVITNAAPLDNNSSQTPIGSLLPSVQVNEQVQSSNILQLLTQPSSNAEQRTSNKDVSKEQTLANALNAQLSLKQ